MPLLVIKGTFHLTGQNKNGNATGLGIVSLNSRV
jgi:hypothetical protein